MKSAGKIQAKMLPIDDNQIKELEHIKNDRNSPKQEQYREVAVKIMDKKRILNEKSGIEGLINEVEIHQ